MLRHNGHDGSSLKLSLWNVDLRSVFLPAAWLIHRAPQKSAACLTLRALAQPHAACLPDLTPEPGARRTSACLPSPCKKPPRRRRAAARARLEPDDTNDSDEDEEGLAQAEHELQPGARLKRRRRPQSPKIARLRRRRTSRARDPQSRAGHFRPVGRRLLPASLACLPACLTLRAAAAALAGCLPDLALCISQAARKKTERTWATCKTVSL